ncbi:hypothetical protein [Streptomyces luteogriseus]|uniref:hypothetical protein n=1 Tax=Streptomyces luteogriseus TaxID=68233 RepID=UPI0037F9E897
MRRPGCERRAPLTPLSRAEALAWWEGRVADVAAGRLAVWVACDGGQVLGTVSSDTETGSPAEHLYRSSGRPPIGAVPDCAAGPGGVHRPTTISCKRIPATALTR